jgi:hypothetical protein
MLGYFYGSPVGNRLNRLMRDEKITPTEGIREEFNQIIDRMLSKIEQRSRVEKNLQALREKLARSPSADKSGDSSDKHEPEA